MKLLNVSELYSLIEQVVKVIIFNIKFFGAHGNRALRNLFNQTPATSAVGGYFTQKYVKL